MKSRFLIYGSVMIYEIIRIVFVLTTRPEFAIEVLPLSWYAGVPLLCLPLIFVYLMYRDGVKKSLAGNLYVIQKATSLVGFGAYVMESFPYALFNATLNEFYSLKLLVFVVLFFGIDVIMCVVILLMNQKKKVELEGEICK